MPHSMLVLAALLMATTSVQAQVEGEDVAYSANGTELKGYLAYDRSIKGKRPGILVVPEWWGQNEYARRRARMLAAMGYTALAVDMFGNGKTTGNPEEAAKLSGQIYQDLPLALARFKAAMQRLEAEDTVEKGQIGAIGYCFGGGVALIMARQGVDLKAVASFHGNLATDTPARSGVVKARLAIFTGADDPMVPESQVAAFAKEMKEAGVDYSLVTYPGAVHAFTNPNATEIGKRFNLPIAYNEAADEDSWKRLGPFLESVFGPRK